MSNSIVPIGPSQKDIQEMARLRAIMNGESLPAIPQPQQGYYQGGHQGTRQRVNESAPPPPAYSPSYGTSREEVDAMKNILGKLNKLSGDDRSMEQVVSPRQNLVESHQPTANSSGFEVIATIKESGGKEISRYHVVDGSRQDVIGDLSLRESAQAIAKLMNKGQLLEGSRVQEIVDLEEEISRCRMDTANHRKRYQRAMELGETAAAQVFKDRFNVARANALAAQDQISSIAKSIR